MQAFVVVSGLPASGKTTLASVLAAKLPFPLLDKDAFLEVLFQLEGIGDTEWRRSLSHRADAQFREAAANAERAVLASWWRHPRSTADSGTPTDWLVEAPRALVEVHCSCRASIAAARFLARSRHPGHLDQQRSSDNLLALLEQQESLGPLFPEKAITVSTEVPVDVAALVGAVKSALRENHDVELVFKGGKPWDAV